MHIYLVNILTLLGSIIIGYFFGSIPTGVIIGRVFFKKDPRDFGSGNIGGTNVSRVFGKKIGALVTILDMIKTLIPLYLVFFFVNLVPFKSNFVWNNYPAASLFYWVSGLFAVIGHCYSFFLKFKGGKAVSCFMAILLGTSWTGLLVGLVFIILVRLTKIVSLSSMTSGAFQVLLSWILVLIGFLFPESVPNFMWKFSDQVAINPSIFFGLTISVSYSILVCRHKANILRLKSHTENKINY